MNISAVNCTPIKPQASFKGENEFDYDKILAATTKVNDEFVNSEDVKSPLAAAISLGIAGVLAFASGKQLGSLFSKFVKKAPDYLDDVVAKSGKYVNIAKEKLATTNTGKVAKVRNLASKGLGFVQSKASTAYEKIANFGLHEGADIVAKKANAFNNVAGCIGLASVFPTVLKRDTNEDGVSDILQKSHNAYTGTKTKMDGVFEKAGVLAELAQIIA